jgi:Leucine-rich repeat (LRR) protein
MSVFFSSYQINSRQGKDFHVAHPFRFADDFFYLSQLPNLTTLSLSSLHLTQLPAAVGQFSHLNNLFLADNQLATLPYGLGKFRAPKLSLSYFNLISH